MNNCRSHHRDVLTLLVLVVMVGCDAQKSPQSAVTNIAGPDQGTGLRVELVGTDDHGAASIDVIGLSASELQTSAALGDSRQRESVLQVFVGERPSDDLPAIAGTITVVGEALQFTPRYPFSAGLEYCVRLDRSALTDIVGIPPAPAVLPFSMPRPDRSATEIAHVYPTTDQVPENHLKFYIHFSAPMSRGEAYQRLHLLDTEGHELPAVFLELGEELWDPAMQRFTLLFDPGRVKRGLVPREELGAVLTAGRDYTLVIDGDWNDANGQPLAGGLRKPVHVTAVDETPIDIKTWKLVAPPAESRAPLTVTFPEPLDHALLERVLHVQTAAGEEVTGAVEISLAETRWQLTPEHPWSTGSYQLVVQTTLEDLAGNAIGRAFDVDLFGPVTERIETETVSLPFTVAAP